MDKGWLQSEDGRLIIPENSQWKILKVLHRNFHLGAKSTYQMASRLFEGKNVMKTLKNIIQRYEICQKHNPKTEKLAKSGLQQSGKYPGEDWEIDFTHMPKANGYSCLQVWVDTFTAWIFAWFSNDLHALLNKKSLAQTHICKKSALTHSPL